MASNTKLNCLIILSKEGVSAQSFIQCFTMTHTAFNVQLATPGGKQPEFLSTDDQSRRWLSDFNTKPFSVPLCLEVIDAQRYSCLIVPHSPGAVHDLANNTTLGEILAQFVRDRKLVCAVGLGVAALLSCVEMPRDSQSQSITDIQSEKLKNSSWIFKSYSMTGSTVCELACAANFGSLPVIVEDEVRDRGGSFSASGESGAVHVVVDRHLVTGQNEASTITAVQNLVLLANQRQGKSVGK
ncbi:glutamine amidotransferase-like class 1 domain-containing protein 1 [Thrips palmi]|uniref:Glutamine amidotransferase-like class 1 domain-containing protein 1 n=1 Tax=Thrips palmi TaxID=161013 RepID=A0A6P8YNC8_THRPL|nr:glutamine amidotransferase-like class 1 domain-containing protein 1 [Thrips palmi]